MDNNYFPLPISEANRQVDAARADIAALKSLDESRASAEREARQAILTRIAAFLRSLGATPCSTAAAEVESGRCFYDGPPATAEEVDRAVGMTTSEDRHPQGWDMSLPAELQTDAWRTAFAALRYEHPGEDIRDVNLIISATEHGWQATYRRRFPCCGLLGDACWAVADADGGLQDLAVAIKSACDADDASGDSRCPDDHR